MTVKDITIALIQSLEKIYEKSEATTIAQLYIEKKYGVNTIAQALQSAIVIKDAEIVQYTTDVAKLLQHYPIQYLLQEAWFYKFPFLVNDAVLIPRPETEQLVVLCLTKIKELNITNPRIIEVGTGSGCIAISIKKELPTATITAIDVSNEALVVAQQNAQQLNAAIEYKQINFLQENEWLLLGNYDIIISNPPYIPTAEMTTMDNNVVAYEPHLALFVEDTNALIFYEKLALFAKQQQAYLCCEISEHKGIEVIELLKKLHYTQANLLQDYQQKDRMIWAK